MKEQPIRPASLVGARVRRITDPRLLRGEGRYVDDFHMEGMLHAAIVRSPVAHADITSFDTSAAEADLILGVDEISGSTNNLRCVWLTPDQKQTEVPIAEQRVRYVGQPLGIVVAGSRALAEDAVEEIDIDFEDLPSVADAERALEDGAPLLQPEWGTNVAATLEVGDSPVEVNKIFAGAAHVIERRLRIPRIAPSPMETRGLVASWDRNLDELTVWSSTQTPHHVRDHLAHTLRLTTDQVRVIAPELGGGFGAKEHLYVDEILVCLASMRLGRPVKWIEDRSEHFTATLHGRDAIHYARLALDKDNKFLAIQSRIVGNLGAHPSNVGTGPFRISSTMLPGQYRFERAGTTIEGVLTNTTPTGAYRGFGMQEAAWVRERLVDEAARELGVDPFELRQLNFIQSDELPYTTRTFQEYDSGDYAQGLDMVRELVLKDDEPASTNTTRVGTGYATHVEFTGLGPSPVQKIVGFHLGGFETAEVRVDPDGAVIVRSGVTSMGQGIETALAQLAADQLGVGLERVRVELSDTKVVPYSAAGSIASRSATVGGGAAVVAAEKLAAKMRRIAAHQLEADPDDIELVDEVFRVRGVSDDVGQNFNEVARLAWLGWDLPEGESPGLEVRHLYEPSKISYSYSSHAARVEVDLETGRIKVIGYWVSHDAGKIINPTIVDGQIKGGVAQGLGIALFEKMTYGEAAQPTTTTFLDYLMPVSSELPNMSLTHSEHLAPHTPGGMKGIGEGGVIPTPAAIANAVAAAVPEIAEYLLETPMTPAVIWELLVKEKVARL